MKILVNAFPVAYGGGLILTLNIIKSFRLYSNINFLVVTPNIDCYNKVTKLLMKRRFLMNGKYWL